MGYKRNPPKTVLIKKLFDCEDFLHIVITMEHILPRQTTLTSYAFFPPHL